MSKNFRKLLTALFVLLGLWLALANGRENQSGSLPPEQPLYSLEASEPLKIVTATPTAALSAKLVAPPVQPTTTPLLPNLPTPTPEPPPPTPQTYTIPPAPQAIPTPVGVLSQTIRVPILMYHYIAHPPPQADKYRVNLSLAPEDFEIQMAYLADNGYTSLDLYELASILAGQRPLPEKPVILTFDDGYLDAYTNAYPILEKYDMKGTFFIATQFIDDGNPNYITWNMIKEMAASGHRFEPHSKTHPNLTQLDWQGLIWQLRGSQETLAAHLGYTPKFFAYPSGRYNAETMLALSELQFWGAVTTQNGREHSYSGRFEWPRLRIVYRLSLGEFADMVRRP